MPKTSMRRDLLARRRLLPETEIQRLGALVQRQFIGLPEFVAAPVVALYSPVHGEVETGMIFALARELGKTVVFPRTNGSHLEFVVVEALSELQPGPYGILEPVTARCLALDDIPLLAVPGVAFSCDGVRLGYGKGYYDRSLALARKRPCLTGLCYSFQLLATLPRAAHDIHMDILVTEEGFVRI